MVGPWYYIKAHFSAEVSETFGHFGTNAKI